MADNPYLTAEPAPSTTANPYLVPVAATVASHSNASAVTHKVETPKNARQNPLRTILDVLDVPLAAVQNYAADVGHAIQKHDLGYLLSPLSPLPMPVGPHAKQLYADLTHGGPHAVAQNDIYPRMGSLQRVLNDPTASPAAKRAARIFMNDPGLAAGTDFLQEWFLNPSNVIVPHAVGTLGKLAGKTVRAAREASPAVDSAATAVETAHAGAKRAVGRAAAKTVNAVVKHVPGSTGHALRALVDRYAAAGLPERGGAPFVQAAFAMQAAPEHAAAVATNRIRSIFDGLTTAQKKELQKLSYLDENGQRFASRDAVIPEPAKGPTLEERASQVRNLLFDLDRRQAALGIRKRAQLVMPRGKNPNAVPRVQSGDLYDSGRFFPMRQFGDQPVFQSQDLAEAAKAENPEELTNVISGLVSRGRGRFSSGVGKSAHKLERDLPDILNPEVEADLHPEYDPAFQLERHVAETERAIANEQSKIGLESIPSIDPETGVQRTAHVPGVGTVPLAARMPLQYFLEPNRNRPLAMIFGQGEAGRKAMENYVKRAATAQAQDLARQDPRVLALAQQNGIDVARLGRSVRNVNLSPLKARMAEAQNAQRGTGRLAQNIAGIAGRTNATMAGRASDLTARAEQLGAEADAAASVPKASIPKGMDADAAAAASARNAARDSALNPLPIARAESAADEAVRAAQTAGRGFDRAQAAAQGLNSKAIDRLDKLSSTLEERAGRAQTAAAFQKAVNHYYGDVFETVAKNIREDAAHAPHGYKRESDLGLASPSGRDMAIDEAFGRFLKDQKLTLAETDAARKWWRALDVMNRIARMSIVLIPTVHGINNLGMAYLAEGGNPARMAEILAGRRTFSDALRQRAYDAGAATDWSQRAFSLDEEGAHATTAIPEHAAMIGKRAGPLAKAVTPIAKAGLKAERVYNRMNDWLFRQAEQGYAIDLFDKFTKSGMTDGAAAIRVRNALGRYDNITPRELAMGLNRIFYFYPWMKTAIPFWVKKGVLDPKWWSAPVRAIQTNNEQQGYDDPSRPFTMTLGKRNNGQQFRRYTFPVPQRVLENVAEAARIPLDIAKGDWNGAGADAKAPINYIAGHFNPALQLAMDFGDLAHEGEQRIAPWNTFKTQPGQTGAQQNATIAGNILGRFISPVARAESVLQDPIAGIAAYLSGAFTYGLNTQSEQSREKMIRQRANALFHPYLQAATSRKDDAAVQRLTALREAAIQRAISGTQQQPKPSPAASSNPYLQP